MLTVLQSNTSCYRNRGADFGGFMCTSSVSILDWRMSQHIHRHCRWPWKHSPDIDVLATSGASDCRFGDQRFPGFIIQFRKSRFLVVDGLPCWGAAEAQRDECTGVNKLQATSGQLPGSNLGSWLLNDLERCHMEPLILHTPATLGHRRVCLHCRFTANIAQTPAETPPQHGSVCPHLYRVIPHFPSACVELPAWACAVLSGASLVRDSLLGSEHSCLDIHLWGCDRDIEMCKELDLWFPL